MARRSKYPEELRQRAVRMVAEVAPQHKSERAAITAVAGKLGVAAPETVRRSAGPRSTQASGLV